MTYETVWSGSLDRLGACQSLTSYRGASSLNNAPLDAQLTHEEIHALQVALGVWGRQPRPAQRAA